MKTSLTFVGRGVLVVGAVLAWIAALNLGLWLISQPSDLAVVAGVLLTALLGLTGAAAVWGRIRKHFQFAALALAAIWATGCGTTIQPGHAGIIVDAYGKDRGVQSYTATTGRVWYNPITTTVFEYPTFVQSVVFTASPHEGRSVNEEITFTNADQMSIAADVSLSYSLLIDKLPAFYVKFRSDDLNQFTYGYLRSLMRDKFNETAGHYTVAQIMGDNGPFLKQVKDALQADLEPLGVHLESQFGFIGAPRPPEQVIGAINAKAQANQLAIQKQNELVQVTADAAKVVAKAEGDAKATLIWATAQADANRRMSESLTGNLIELKRLEKWNGILPQVSGSATPWVSLK